MEVVAQLPEENMKELTEEDLEVVHQVGTSVKKKILGCHVPLSVTIVSSMGHWPTVKYSGIQLDLKKLPKLEDLGAVWNVYSKRNIQQKNVKLKTVQFVEDHIMYLYVRKKTLTENTQADDKEYDNDEGDYYEESRQT